ncbi:MAG TPA: hypothetical protein VK956_12625 [Verrucomicrobium sp.]|nr:hypothetical protein [Verrucomicrobium sp.]
MFRRLVHEHWHDVVPVIAFILTFAVFIVAFIRAVLAKKESIQHMAVLPLDLEEAPAPTRVACSDSCQRCTACRHREDAHLHH